MWRTFKVIVWTAVVVCSAVFGARFLNANQGLVNVQFPMLDRQSGETTLGLALLSAAAAGLGAGLLILLVISFGLTLHAASLKRDLKRLKRQIHKLELRDLPEEPFDKNARIEEEEEDRDALERARAIDVVPTGPVRGGSTAAPIGGEDDEEDEAPIFGRKLDLPR